MSYAVQFIADDLAVAFVVVSVGHRVLQRPEEGVVHLRTHTHRDSKQTWSRLSLFNIQALVGVSEVVKRSGLNTSRCYCHTGSCGLCYLQVFQAVQLNGSVLRQAAGSVLQRGEDSGGDIDVVALWEDGSKKMARRIKDAC